MLFKTTKRKSKKKMQQKLYLSQIALNSSTKVLMFLVFIINELQNLKENYHLRYIQQRKKNGIIEEECVIYDSNIKHRQNI